MGAPSTPASRSPLDVGDRGATAGLREGLSVAGLTDEGVRARHDGRVAVTKRPAVPLQEPKTRVTIFDIFPAVEAQRPTFSLAGAGSVLLGFTGASMVVGALLGWVLGSWPVGLAVGVVVGIPLGVAMTVLKYRNAI